MEGNHGAVTALQNQNVFFDNMPRHVAIIMDGNGRWAKQQGKSRIAGHRAGIKAAQCAIQFAVQMPLMVLTLYAFSRENWCRPEPEVKALLALLDHALRHYAKQLDRYNIRLRVIGDRIQFNRSLQEVIIQTERATAGKTGLVLNIAANYSGQWDVVQAVRHVVFNVQQQQLQLEQIDETLFARYLCMADLPPVDLMIRTSGEYRLSNFLLWQMAYAELYFTDVLWPDFNEEIFHQAIQSFKKRKRRFGRV